MIKLNGVCVATRQRVKPPSRTTCSSRAGPAWAPRAVPTSWLIEAGASSTELETMQRAAEDEMASARAAAEAAPWPDLANAFSDIQDLGAPGGDLGA